MSVHDRTNATPATKSPTVAPEQEHPTLEGENSATRQNQDAGGGAGGEDDAAPADPAPSGDHLAAALQALLSAEGGSAGDPNDKAASATIDAWPNLGERAALWDQAAFWGAGWWSEAGRDHAQWR